MGKLYYLIFILAICPLLSIAQNMGIGTASPQEKLEVAGAIKIGNSSANNAGTIRYDASAQKFQVNIAGTWYDVATGSGSAISSITYNASNNQISVVEGGNTFTVDLSDLEDNTDNQTVSLSGTTLIISGGNSVDLNGFMDNTDSQTLNLSGNNLSISGGNSVNLAAFANTDAQTLSITSNNLAISGGNNVSLGPYLDNTDSQTLGLSGNTLSISGGNSVSLSSFANTDAQTLSLSGNTLSISGGNNVNLSAFANTDDQTFAEVYQEGGNTVQLTAANGDLRFYRGASTEMLTLKESNGYIGIGTNNPLTNLNIQNLNESTTQGNFTGSLNNAGVLVTTEYTNGAYTPGLYWSTTNDNPSKPKAGVYVQLTSGGSRLIFGTSNSYVTGVTNSALMINEGANVILSSLASGSNGLATATTSGQLGKTAYSGNGTDVLNGNGTFVSINSLTSDDWTQSGSNLYPNSTSWNVGIGTSSPQRKLHVSDGGEISLLQSTSVATDSKAGIFWHTGTDYAIYRSPGSWTSPNYQQLTLNWPTGMVLNPGSSYGKSYVDVQGNGLMVTSGNIGVGTTSPSERVEVDGYVKSRGVINSNGTVTESTVTTKRYHVSSRYATANRTTVPLDMNIIKELCGDEDGCEVRGLMRRWSNNSQTEAASRGPYIFTYNDADGHWRLYDNTGVDGASGTQHVWQWWDCYLTDGNYSNGSNLGDPGKGLGLLNWNSDYANSNKTCEITFID